MAKKQASARGRSTVSKGDRLEETWEGAKVFRPDASIASMTVAELSQLVEAMVGRAIRPNIMSRGGLSYTPVPEYKPEGWKPEQWKPERWKPEQLKPEQWKPERGKPEVVKPEWVKGGSHANSGPTGHANEPGHANFTSHANSGPTGHANEPGHANFTSHANSGPTGHANEPGHANFTDAHANSGPSGHANKPGHADFTSGIRLPALIVTLANGLIVNIPAGGPRVVEIGGQKITRA